MNKLLIGIVALVVIVAGVFVFTSSEDAGDSGILSAVASSDVYGYFFVHGPFSEGGGRTASTPTSAAYTWTFADMAESKILTFTASTTMPALTATLPASTTFPLPPEIGAERRWIIENPFTAAATTTTIAAGTGIDLQEPDGQNVVLGINNYAWMTCIRGADSGAAQDIVCSIDETIPAD